MVTIYLCSLYYYVSSNYRYDNIDKSQIIGFFGDLGLGTWDWGLGCRFLEKVGSEKMKGVHIRIRNCHGYTRGKGTDTGFNHRSYFYINFGINPDKEGHPNPRAKSSGLFIFSSLLTSHCSLLTVHRNFSHAQKNNSGVYYREI
jgi:hypothetical protein